MKKNILLSVVCFFITTICFAQSPQPAQKPVTASGGIEVAPIPDQTFTGKAITPEPVIKFGTIVLKKDVDYTLSYQNNINVGAATVTMTGKGNYQGTKVVNFKIIPKSFGGTSTAAPAPRPAPAPAPAK